MIFNWVMALVAHLEFSFVRKDSYKGVPIYQGGYLFIEGRCALVGIGWLFQIFLEILSCCSHRFQKEILP